MEAALRAVQTLGVGVTLTDRIASLESEFCGQAMPQIAAR
jgi:hypothetical protein